jgi:hypothetical protein
MADALCTLPTAEHGKTLALVSLFVPGHADNEIHVGESLFCLFQLSHVSVKKPPAMSI